MIMKLKNSNISRNAGSVLLVTLLLSIIMGVTLGGYLIMAMTQNRSVVRSQTWNSAIALTEAGIEDGLQEINKYAGTFVLLTNWISTASSDNWSLVDSNVFYVRRYMGEDYYDVYITNSNPMAPTVYASGTTLWHYNYASAASQSMFAAVGTSPTATGLTNVTRGVVVATKVDALFNVAMAALQTIDFNGKNVATDSFDSADPLYSTNGLYPYGNVNKTKANGDVVTDDTITNSLSVGNATIKGLVKTGPNGTVAIGPNGSVGDRAWVEGGSSGIETGHFSDDMNVLFPSVTLPTTTWLPVVQAPGGTKVNGDSYDYIILTGGDYSLPGLTGSLYIGSNVTVRIKCTGDVKLTGSSDQIHIASGGSVIFYMASGSFSLGGNGLVNENGNAASFYYFGLPSNTSVGFNGNANFVGAVYAPQAAFSLGGGGNNTYDFIGASVSKSVRMNGHFNFHYDENLARNGFGRGYIPTNWKES
jgi:hypothetical protein